MISRRMKLLAVSATVVVSTAVWSTAALASGGDQDDHFNKPGLKVGPGDPGTSEFSINVFDGIFDVFCDAPGGTIKLPATGLVAEWVTPDFNSCMDDITFNPDTVTVNGNFKWIEIDAKHDEAASEPNATGDEDEVVIPKRGIKIQLAQANNPTPCVVIIAPSGPVKVKGTYDDNGHATINGNVPVSFGAGCGAGVTPAAISWSFTILGHPVPYDVS